MTIANPTTVLALERQVNGTNNDSWNDRYNANFVRIDAAFGAANIDVTAGNVTLVATDSSDTAASATTRPMIINVVGTPTVAREVVWPTSLAPRLYLCINGTGHAVTFKVTGQTGIILAAGERGIALLTGADIVWAEAATDSETVYLAGGKMEKVGTVVTLTGGTATITWSTPFPTACMGVFPSPIGTSAALATPSAVSAAGCTITVRDLTGAGLTGANVYVRAIGY